MPLVRGFHSFDSHFVQVPNSWVRDTQLSLKAIGLLVQIMSHEPGWKMSIRSIARMNNVGIDTIKTAVEELEKAGYLARSQKQLHNSDGTFADYEFITQNPSRNPVTVKSRHGETGHKEYNSLLEENKNKEISAFLEFWEIYPNKKDKEKAKRAFSAALKKTDTETILRAAKKYRDDPTRKPDYTKYPATWLNAASWENDYTQPQEDRSQRIREEQAAYEAFMRELEANAAPPPMCEHGKTIARCPRCIRKMSDG